MTVSMSTVFCPMVKITITLQRNRQAWHVLEYDVQFLYGHHALSLDPPPARGFINEKAAANHIRRMVLSRLKLVRHNATGTDISCDVTIQPPGKASTGNPSSLKQT